MEACSVHYTVGTWFVGGVVTVVRVSVVFINVHIHGDVVAGPIRAWAGVVSCRLVEME